MGYIASMYDWNSCNPRMPISLAQLITEAVHPHSSIQSINTGPAHLTVFAKSY
ncbi:predicted protein [Histoplasma mississippiense (nom. inval.)]|uniref:predicted protein n=1 Tax=Ajellomyces capsulatus (strain NAm1 / WU24) TaxID=2059318 RepID=UPI000157BEEA|nr:predicted protein [Histoplasma mississippiense (nom. inval.)]EDN06966.1 predicted protein [Histoplasma mississippiense (nom. inval.)]